MLNDVTQTSAQKSKPSLRKWPYRLWPKGVVLYKFFPKNTFNASELEMVKTCMKTIEKNTCVRFKERNELTKGVVRIYKNKNRPDVCGVAHVGYASWMTTVLFLVCMEPDVAYHEFMHTLGFDHEEMRSKQTDYCGKVIIPKDGKLFKAVDGAEVMYRQNAAKDIDKKFVKKINGLYCCEKKTWKREPEVFVERILGSVLSWGEKVRSDLKGPLN